MSSVKQAGEASRKQARKVMSSVQYQAMYLRLRPQIPLSVQLVCKCHKAVACFAGQLVLNFDGVRTSKIQE